MGGRTRNVIDGVVLGLLFSIVILLITGLGFSASSLTFILQMLVAGAVIGLLLPVRGKIFAGLIIGALAGILSGVGQVIVDASFGSIDGSNIGYLLFQTLLSVVIFGVIGIVINLVYSFMIGRASRIGS